MKIHYILRIRIAVYALFAMVLVACEKREDRQGEKITLDFKLPDNFDQRDVRIYAATTKYVMVPYFRTKRPTLNGEYGRWELYSNDPLLLDLSPLLGNKLKQTVFEPGDSITIDPGVNGPVFTGRGYEKLQLIMEVKEARNALPLPANPDYGKVVSYEDFIEWNGFLNNLSVLTDDILAKYEDRINKPVFDYIKQQSYSDIEHKRLMKFGVMVARREELKISTETLEHTFDSTINNSHLEWLYAYTGNPYNYYIYYDVVRRRIERKYHFDYQNDSLKSVDRKLEYAQLIKSMYEGEVEQSCLTYLVADQGLKEHVLKDEHVPVIDSLLRDYYARPGYENYKEYMRGYEEKVKKWIAEKHMLNKAE